MLAVVIEDLEQLALFMGSDVALPALLERGLIHWLVAVAELSVLGLALGFLVATWRRRNPIRGFLDTLAGVRGILVDVVMLPFGLRRVWAIANLSFKEAIRRRILYVFLVFLVPFLFAGWYLPNSDEGQLKFLVAFVNSAMTWLMLPLVVFLTSMSMPNDIKSKTIQTIVTKPVRLLEILVGRILGYMAIFTIVLLAMGGVSLLYLVGQTSETVRKTQWTARAPVLARPLDNPADFGLSDDFRGAPPLLFNKGGVWDVRGINTGKEWAYRSHVAGRDSAHWYFRFDPATFANKSAVDVEMTFNIFKTTADNPYYEGTQDSGVYCEMLFRSYPATAGHDHKRAFRVNANRVTTLSVPAELFSTGKLEVIARSVSPNQYIGMAAPDLYFLAGARSFEENFIKGLLSLWLKILLLTCVAVSASTVLNGFVTVLLATMIYIIGFSYEFMMQVIWGEIKGGGPLESFIRLITQTNQTIALDPTFVNLRAVEIDRWILAFMRVVAQVAPDLSQLDVTYLVADGVSIPAALLLRNALIVFGYCIPVVFTGYVLFRSREMAA